MTREADEVEAVALPWEWAPEKAPLGVGICLSGGGLRASSFSLGVLQALQEKRGLMFGNKSADLLAVVSGGSYAAATFSLTAATLAVARPDPTTPNPLAAASPEAQHVVSHGRYLVEDGFLRTVARFVLPAFLNIGALLALFIWMGFMLADVAWIAAERADAWEAEWLTPPRGGRAWLQWPLSGVALLGGAVVLRGLSKDGGPKRILMPLIGSALLFATAASFVARVRATPPLSNMQWWQDVRLLTLWLLVVFVVLAASAYWTLSPPSTKAGLLGTKLVGIVAVGIPRAVGLVFLSFSTAFMARILEVGTATAATTAQTDNAGAVILGTLVGGLLASAIPHRVSLHRRYRDLLSRCFAVRRTSGMHERIDSVPNSVLSEVAPSSERARAMFPRLLVCATANVKLRDADGRRHQFAPFVFSHDRCGVPGVGRSSFETKKLELARVAAGWPGRREPLLSLMSAIAMTGAALSPSMGKMTLPALRPFIAAINLRTGTWMPNPLSRRVRDRVRRLTKPGPVFRDRGIGGGFDQLVPELIGIQTADGRQVYVTDGGHYDNLGLTTLLRARCSEIWCVDSEPDKKGRARQLRQVKALAKAELGVEVDVDLNLFRVSNGYVGSSYAEGVVRYPEGLTARLVVVKLGLEESAPSRLKEYRLRDRRFPYHPTLSQSYGPLRVDAYRQLGFTNACAALEASASTSR